VSARRGWGRTGIGALAAIGPLAGLAVFAGGCATTTSGGPAPVAGDPSAPAVHALRPIIALHLDAGHVTGGSESAFADDSRGYRIDALHYGDGYLVGGGVAFTPLWIGDRVGLGAGVDVLFKYASFDGDAGHVTQSSMPVLLTANALIGLDHGARWYLLVRAGLETDYNRRFSGITGRSGSGVFGEIGPMFLASRNIGVGATFRAAGMILHEFGVSMDELHASNLGFAISVSYNYASEKVRLSLP
jgi:hypothetical protein